MIKQDNHTNFYIKIPEVQQDVKRPLWSVVIPTHNCASYLKHALKSVLDENIPASKMEIIVVDDHSTKDNPEAIVDEIGNNRVQFIRQSKNVGKIKNYETGLLNSRGKLIHLLHGDDKIMKGFYKEIERIFDSNIDAKAAFCRTIYIDDQSRWTGMTGMLQDQDGIVTDMAQKLYTEQYIQTPSMVVKREVYETIGTFDRRLNCMEDWEMWIRIANTYPIAATNEVLALYRIHQDNATHLTFKDGSALSTHQIICNIVDEYIHPKIKKGYYKLRNEKQAVFWLLFYQNFKRQLSLQQKWQFSKYILKMHLSLKNIYRLLT